jgi:hypothetical protein
MFPQLLFVTLGLGKFEILDGTERTVYKVYV